MHNPQRVKRENGLAREKKLHQVKVAEYLRIAPSSVNRYIQGETPITVAFLEAIERDTRIPIAELVAPPGTIHQLNADEAALIRWLRRWPLSVTRALCAFLAFFADEPSELRQTRNLHELWRRMPAKQREWFYSVAVLTVEGMLAPDHQAQLLQRLAGDQSAYAARLGGPKTTPDDDET